MVQILTTTNDSLKLVIILIHTFLKKYLGFILHILYFIFYILTSKENNDCKEEAPKILFYYIFLYKIFVLTCLKMA